MAHLTALRIVHLQEGRVWMFYMCLYTRIPILPGCFCTFSLTPQADFPFPFPFLALFRHRLKFLFIFILGCFLLLHQYYRKGVYAARASGGKRFWRVIFYIRKTGERLFPSPSLLIIIHAWSLNFMCIL
ncbi:hypothetical protein BGZ63DRAFT_29509 [Mariannaea sp. PMI_226]|nr:hypothetical protein BGZ63DRAFT_29509 [Mariannaea sp. PMI_226]